MRLLLALLAVLFITSVAGESISDMKYKVSYVFNSPDEYHNVTTYVDLNVSNWKDSLVLTDDWKNKILVVDNQTGQILPHWREILDNDTVRIWFIKNWTTGVNIVDVYFDSDGLNSTPEEPDKVFVYFTDFEDKGSWSVITYQTIDWNNDGSIDIADTIYYNKHYIWVNNSKLVFKIPNGQKEVIADTSSNICDANRGFSIKFSVDNVKLSRTLPYWIEQVDDNTFYIWTKVNISANSEKVIYIKKVEGYQPDGDSVFLFFDDFDGTELDKNKWIFANDGSGTGTYTVSNSEITIYGTSNGNCNLVSNVKFEPNVILDIRQKIPINPEGDGTWRGRQGFNAMEAPTVYSDSYKQTVFFVGDDTQKLRVWDGSNKYDTSLTLDTIDNYHTYSLVWLDNGAKLFQDGVLKGEVQSNKNPTGCRIENRVWFGGKRIIDWIRVRRYADKEPFILIIQIDSNTWEVVIGNPNNYDLVDYQIKIPGDGIVSSKTDSLCIYEDSKCGLAFDLDDNGNGYYVGGTPQAGDNILEVERRGSNIIAILNGKIIEELSDSNYLKGRIGVWGESIVNTTMYVDYFLVYNIGNLSLVSQTSPIAMSNDVLTIKNVTFYDEVNLTDNGYALLENISDNITLIFTGDSVIKQYLITPKEFNSTMSFEAPSGGSLTIIESGKVRKIYYVKGENNLSVIWADPNKATLVEWLIRLNGIHNVTIKDSSGKVITEFRSVQTVDTYVIQGRTYLIYIDGKLKEEKTAVDAELIDYAKEESNAGDLIIVPVVQPFTKPILAYTTKYDGENITLHYTWSGEATLLNVSVFDENNTLLFNNAFTAPEQTVIIPVGNASSYWKIEMNLVWSGGSEKYVAYVYKPLPQGGFELLKGWKKWVSIAILFIILVTFSYIHVEAATVATLAIMFFLEVVGFLDWLDYKIKSVLFLLLIIPLALKIKRGW